MSHSRNKVSYSQGPIRDLPTLARVVNLPIGDLLRLAASADRMYRSVPQRKKDGSTRETWDAYRKLKRVQGYIKARILDQVRFPLYLQGGIRDRENPRDYARNAAIHAGQTVLINEDVADFFPSTTAEQVSEIWRVVFRFPIDVATCLTKLTTRRGTLPQGAKTSNHLANLVFHRDEPLLEAHFRAKGLRYSRLTDDISISTSHRIASTEKSEIVRAVYGMLNRAGYMPKRQKHALFTQKGSMRVNNLVVNRRPGLPRSERDTIRAEVEMLIVLNPRHDGYFEAPARVIGRLGKLARFHPAKAAGLKARLRNS